MSRFDIRRTWSLTAAPFFGCLLTASTDETIQVFTGRGNSVYDVMLDFSGSLTAMGIFFAVVLICKRVKQNRTPDEEAEPTELTEPTEQTELPEQPDKTE